MNPLTTEVQLNQLLNTIRHRADELQKTFDAPPLVDHCEQT
ncbi:hypothetical protein [Gimesia maris]|nr:hypothetical protein [Gimesia maris]